MKTKPWALVIDGEPWERSYAILIQDGPRDVGTGIGLSGCSFRLLCILAKRGGWVDKSDLADNGHNVTRYLYRMKKEIRANSGYHKWKVIENDRCGHYRLDAPECVGFNDEKLAAHPDYRVASMFQKERENAN